MARTPSTAGLSRAILILCLAALALGSAASATAGELLVNPDWLKARLGDDKVVVLHVGPKEGYDKAHIPGAQLIALADVSEPDTRLMLQMASVERLRDAFEQRGISDGTRIVLYQDAEWISPVARVFVTLDYLGLAEQVSLLDGGLAAWRAAGHAVTAETTARPRGRLTVRANESVLADAAWVSAHLDDSRVRIIDARDSEFYTGENRGRFPRAGHIRGAVSIPFSTLTDAPHLTFKREAELRGVFEKAAGGAERELVVYCHIGQQASHVYLAARLLGYRVRLYDGSFQEWSERTDLPVATGPVP
ncbi:MAG TPA: sulfurtransferase [Vicinamibacterales bacterium]|nr:sulfurtransferase [Vicinamibacterales bacterium]